MAKKSKKPEAAPIVENIDQAALDLIMGDRFAIYAQDVIQSRALPDARDGLKPVQRRILFDMWNTGNTIEKPTKKCAHIVGDVMGKYHPHGDSSIYGALVHMSQPWNMRYPLIDFQGNNGSIDGDPPAAYRYTEARLSALSNEMLRDIDLDTVPMALTFDDTLKEPVVLPSRFPNLLVNGSEGIAVGIATQIPPHNLREVCQAVAYRVKHPNCDIEKLMEFVPGPDFPTGGIIAANEALKDIYRTGRGKASITSKTEIVFNKDGTSQIIVTEIPFKVVKSDLVKAIDKIRFDKTIPGIDEVRDESDKEGLRIAIDIKESAKPDAILAYLLSKTPLQSNFSAYMIAIVDGHPMTMGLANYCDCYIQHQLDVITRRSNFLLAKDQARLNIVEGLIKAISVLDEVVAIIRKSEDKADSKKNLEKRFGFNPEQSEAIVMMPLYKLSHTDVTTLEEERKSLLADLELLNGLLNNQDQREDLIINDLKAIAKKYGDDRKTQIIDESEVKEASSLNKRDLIAVEDVYVVATRDGYLKRSSIKSWRGSGGMNGAKPGIKSGDSFIYNALVSTKDFLIMFSNKGNFAYVPVNEIKDAKWNDEGFHINQLVSMQPGEKFVSAIGVRKFRDDLFIVMLSKKGSIKRCRLSDFQVTRRSKGVAAIRFGYDDDEIVAVTLTSGNSDLFLIDEEGNASRYNENEVKITNIRSGGVKCGPFKGRNLVGLCSFLPNEKASLGRMVIITDRGATRVIDDDRAPLLTRLAKPTSLFHSLKKEPHFIVFLGKVGEKKPPFTYDAVLQDFTRVDVVFNDFYLSPADTAVFHRGDFMSAKGRIVAIGNEDSILVDENTVSLPLPVKTEINVEEESVIEEGEPSSFEQLSLFDADEE